MKKCMQCGGATKKMAKGGQALNKAKGYAKPTVGGSNTKDGIYGVPNAGPTGPNATGTYDYKKGGSIKKYQNGGSKPPLASTTPGEIGTGMMKKGGVKKMAKGGSTFGMLSVKAGVDKNPKATAADRIAGAKMSKKKMGGTIKKK